MGLSLGLAACMMAWRRCGSGMACHALVALLAGSRWRAWSPTLPRFLYHAQRDYLWEAGSTEGGRPENIDVSALPLPDTAPPGPLPVVPELGDWLTPQKPVTVREWSATGAAQVDLHALGWHAMNRNALLACAHA